jgi:CRISPR-associated endonuclease/helicase Cas3
MDIFDLDYHPETSIFELGHDTLKVWAHPGESLDEHVSKTKIFFQRFIDEKLIKHFYEHFKAQDYLNLGYNTFVNLLYRMVDFHDAAKISFNFQLNRLKNTDILETLKKHDLGVFVDSIEIKHSYVSSLLYFSFLNDNLDLKENIITLLFSYIIYGHHTSIKDILNQQEFVWDDNEISENTFGLFSKYYFDKEFEDVDLGFYRDTQEQLYKFLKNNEDPAISFFYSYLYSLLVTSDVIASSYASEKIESVKEHAEKWNNRIDDTIRESMINNFHNVDYNRQFESSACVPSEEETGSLEDINDLRTEMMKEASFNLTKSLKEDPSKRIFYLNMPTGGGKTNTSMKLALDILENTGVDRVIYAMPFINIIEQNYDVIKDNFGLNEDKGEIRKIYSASETIFSEASDDDKSEIIMRDSFFDYPVICTTFVSLFNALIKNKKRYKYSLSSLANSVVILDEIQSLPLRNWTSLYYLINEMVENYNIYFIIMSATLPDFDNLKLSKDVKFNYNSVHLIKNPMKYFSHPTFDRTQVDENVFEMEIDADDSSDVKDFLGEILDENFENDYNHGLIVLNTIKVSKWIYNCLKELKGEYGFELDLLNSTIIPSEKQKIIYKINNMDESSRYILVSTQSVEAGVDVSFDFVVRDFATLDSIEQIQGRCNRSRELNKRFEDETKRGKVYLTYLKRKNRYDHEFIYDKAELETKIKETRSIIAENPNYDYKNVLNYYEKVSQHINHIQDKKEENFVFMDRNNIDSWNQLKYSDLLDSNYGIHIIQNNGFQCSFFVKTRINLFVNDQFPQNLTMVEFLDPEELDKIYKNNETKFIFTSNELNYLKRYESKYRVQIIKNNTVDGSELVKCYFEEIKKFKEDFGAKKILQKEFSSILYKFIFQVTGDESEFEDLIKTNGFTKVGFFYAIPEIKIGNDEDKIYSVETGFNFDFMKLQEENENFI